MEDGTGKLLRHILEFGPACADENTPTERRTLVIPMCVTTAKNPGSSCQYTGAAVRSGRKTVSGSPST